MEALIFQPAPAQTVQTAQSALHRPPAPSPARHQAMRSRAAQLMAEIIRLSLAALFLFSGLVKLRSPFTFLASIYGYQLTGPLLSLVVAVVLPWLEILLSLCLWTRFLYRGALLIASILGLMFSAVIALAIYRQLDISCGCFLASDKISYFTLLRSLSLLAASILAFLLPTRTPVLPSKKNLEKDQNNNSRRRKRGHH